MYAYLSSTFADFPRDRVPVVLAPLLYREEEDITEDRYVPPVLFSLFSKRC